MQNDRRNFLASVAGLGTPSWFGRRRETLDRFQGYGVDAEALYIWDPRGKERSVRNALVNLGANRVFFGFPKGGAGIQRFIDVCGDAFETYATLSTTEVSKDAATFHEENYVAAMREVGGIDGIHLNHETGEQNKNAWLGRYLNYLNEFDTTGFDLSITLDWKWFDTSVSGTTEPTVQRAKQVREHDNIDWLVSMPFFRTAKVLANRAVSTMLDEGQSRSNGYTSKEFLFAIETQNPKRSSAHPNATVHGKSQEWIRGYIDRIRNRLPRKLRRNLIGNGVAIHDYDAWVRQFGHHV